MDNFNGIFRVMFNDCFNIKNRKPISSNLPLTNWLKKITLFFLSSTLLILLLQRTLLTLSDDRDGNGVPVCEPKDTRRWASYSKFRWCRKGKDKSTINLNCHKLIKGDPEALEEAKNWTSPCTYDDKYMSGITSDCHRLRRYFPFWSELYRIPNETNDYPLAFVVIGAKNVEQIVRLFQAIYHQRNLYCITYDNKTSDEFKEALRNLYSCYDNIIMPKNFVDIYWAGFSILQSAMYCLKALTETKSHSWKYVQILSWNDYPLRTNEEFVKIVKILNGSQDSYLARHAGDRSRQFFDVKKSYWTKMNVHLDPNKVGRIKSIPPGNLTEYKGSLATTMSREFVEFMFANEIAKEFYDWINSSYCPEEIYWSTLIHNLHINPPGGFPGACLASYEFRKPNFEYMSRYQVWEDNENKCGGYFTSLSCVFGVDDFQRLVERREFMAHKLYLNFQPALYYCLAQLHFYKTFFPEDFEMYNETFYENLPPVKYQKLVDKKQFDCF